MIHGDFWSINVFFNRQIPGGKIGTELTTVFDWQMSYAGCGLSDLSRFASICVRDDLRQKYEKLVVKRYFDR